MRHLLSKALTESEGELLSSWEVTPKAIVFALTQTLQARNWEGEQLWTVDIERCGPGRLSVADESVFIWNAGAIQEFDLVSGRLKHTYASPNSHITGIFTMHAPDGSLHIISSSLGGVIQVWDHASKCLLLHLDTPHRIVVAFEARQNIARTIGGPSIVHWDLTAGKQLQVFAREGISMLVSASLGNDLVAAGGSSRFIWVFNWKTSQIIATLDIKARVLNGLTLYSPDILLSTDTSGYLSVWCLRTYTLIRRLRIHDHSFLTYTIVGNTFFSGGKEGGGPKNACGLGCSLKSCDLGKLLDGREEKKEEHVEVVEHGNPSSTLWKVSAQADKLAVCLMRRGKPSLEIWGLGGQD